MKRLLCLVLALSMLFVSALAEPDLDAVRARLAAGRTARNAAMAVLEADLAWTLDCVLDAARAVLADIRREADQLAESCGRMVAEMGRWEHLAG